MERRITKNDRIGLLHPAVDAHTLGLASLSSLLSDCGMASELAGAAPCAAALDLRQQANSLLLRDWIRGGRFSIIGFSYRLDPDDGVRLLGEFLHFLGDQQLWIAKGGPVRAVYFGGLPGACERVRREMPEVAGVFQGDETPVETLAVLGIPESAMPARIVQGARYDDLRMDFARDLLRRDTWKSVKSVDRTGAPGFGTRTDSLLGRLDHGLPRGLPPLMRAHVGPWHPDRKEAVAQFHRWCRELGQAGLLDVLSVGSSQLSQSHFFEPDWEGLADGGGVPLRSEEEFISVWEAARPMLLRSYAGTSQIPRMAAMLERTINTAWHALSLWWFCKLDGRGPNGLADNLEEHGRTLAVIAASGKPFEANVPHHFAFRGSDDVSYVVSAFLAARFAKACGIRTYVLQLMLNTPKSTWGVQDLAKARAALSLVRSLEDATFRVVLQPRGGLDYFSPDVTRAMAQLAAVTALMDDIEAGRPDSPQVIHVVSYSEGTHLADPRVVNESIQITRQAIDAWRALRAAGEIPDMSKDPETLQRTEHLLSEARVLLQGIDSLISQPATARGLHDIFRAGFLPVPYLWQCREEFPRAVSWITRVRDGGVRVEREDGSPLSAAERVQLIREQFKEDLGS